MNNNFNKVDIGISACLLGDNVRFDGGHKNLIFANKVLNQYANYHRICPEVGIGLPVPRPTIRLVEENGQTYLRDSKTGLNDYTETMRQFSLHKCQHMAHLNGFIVTSKSPSCGMERLKVFDVDGHQQHKNGVGIFTQTLMEQHPNLPVEEDGRLNDLPLRENFIERVYTHKDWQENVAGSDEIKDLIDFHSRRKYQIMAHSYQAYKSLGKVVANHSKAPLDELKTEYFSTLMLAMKNIATRKRHCNVMQHIQGYFKKQLSTDDKAELTALIIQYKRGLVPLLAPLTLIKHFLKNYPNNYLEQQTYFNPYPLDMGLNG
ncbi:YbgA family protein [Gayadomonas joobiniege]|uniref:YbgA family protein n=1 Tax=Gayadomonas joobiniege TaxID=1234606 RepID=UPI000378EB3A|nr:DUF523 and DUF1722 domain-containing protein [Gayadomonas joobiniege]